MASSEQATQTMCIECEDTEAAYACKQCGDSFCELCYMWLHSRGKRRDHEKTELPQSLKKKKAAPPPAQTRQELFPEPSKLLKINNDQPSEHDGQAVKDSLKLKDDDLKLRSAVLSELEVVPLVERCKYIPLRLDEDERQLLNILEGALEVSEYTDNVDVADSDYGGRYWGFSFWSQPYSKHERGGPSRSDLIKQELQEVFDLLMGLYQSSDYRLGSHLLKTENETEKIAFLQKIFEVGRRYKIMNSEKMRTTYGKMMYILQDAAKPNRLAFPVIIPIKTVYSLLEEKDSLHLITDKRAVELMLAATHDSMPDGDADELASSEKTRKKQAILLQKSEAVKKLLTEYKSDRLSESDILRCINSISDNSTFIALERWPVDRMLYYLTTYFSPTKGHGPTLEIYAGHEGSKLSHDHTTQFTFVLQSLMLWREVINNMFRLWFETEGDLLSSDSPYSLRDTGQGLNRLQQCYNVSRAMHAILGKVQHQARGWVGLSVVHLGDRDVPNALMFIDKYTQVSRILGPVVSCIARLDELEKDASIKRYFDKCGGMEHLKVAVLRDYYRHGFDGSGSDGGSCIDGRLTSSWNWCSKIEKKGYFPIFLLSGFKGFDGRF